MEVRVGREIYGYDFQYLTVIDLKSYYPNVWEEPDFKNPHNNLRIARIPRNPVGYAVFQRSDRAMRLMRLAVDVKWRRQGVGSQIMRYVLDEARDMSMGKITIVVRETNDAAIAFLGKFDFKAKSVIQNAGEDFYYFKRNL